MASRRLATQVRFLFDVHANPATFVYLFTLFVTSAVIAAAGGRLADALLRTQSTNLTNLRNDPVHVLFTSVFWLGSGLRPALLIIPFAVVLAPAERWLGTPRWLAVFALGHVGATTITAFVIRFELEHGWASPSLTHTVDVGFSYGFAAIAGVLAHHVPNRWRRFYVLTGFSILAFDIVAGATFTDIGHLVAWTIGLACGPFVKERVAHTTAVGGPPPPAVSEREQPSPRRSVTASVSADGRGNE